MSERTFKKNEITEGVIWKQLLIFFFPIMLGTLVQQFYTTVDTIIVGRFVGKAALASVGGPAAVIANIVITFFNGLANGAAVIIAQYYGSRDEKRLHVGLHTAYAFSIMTSIAVTNQIHHCPDNDIQHCCRKHADHSFYKSSDRNCC